MEENFGLVAFRSRQQVMNFERDLRRSGVRASIISTPRSVSVGCGLSVRFELPEAQAVREVFRATQPGNLIGFYHVTRDGSGMLRVRPLGMQTGYTGYVPAE